VPFCPDDLFSIGMPILLVLFASGAGLAVLRAITAPNKKERWKIIKIVSTIAIFIGGTIAFVALVSVLPFQYRLVFSLAVLATLVVLSLRAAIDYLTTRRREALQKG
jgi:hypothetical protein